MGQRVVHCVVADDDAELVAAIDSAQNPLLGQDIGQVCGLGSLGVPITSQLPSRVDVIIDFSLPEPSLQIIGQAIERKIPVVVATTGHEKEQRGEIEAAAHLIPILWSANLSLVVNLLFKLTAEAGKALAGKDFDVEIIEHHHRFKADSPSGTALRFADIVEKAMHQTSRRHGREGIVGERPRHEIGLHAVRAGDNVGQHTILFSTLGESLELVHRSSSRDSYAKGAVAAAKFLVGKEAGMYSMADVLGL
jgi:4-hydroxy-tetrahydrodipicolinate reductase